MCRESDSCPYVFPRHTPVSSPAIRPEVFDTYFSSFVTTVLEIIGSRAPKNEPLLAWSKERELNEWFTNHAQMASTYRKKVSIHQKPHGTVKDQTPLTAKTIKIVNQQDNYRCRYCGNSVLPSRFFTKLTKIVGPERFRSVGTNIARHGIKLVFSATADHLVPRSDGGKTDFDNLVTACWPCNYGKANFTLEELGMLSPKGIKPINLDDRVVKLLLAIGLPNYLPPH